jgi:hypothetical protein
MTAWSLKISVLADTSRYEISMLQILPGMKITMLADTSRYEISMLQILPGMKISLLENTSRYENLCASRFFQV